MDKKIIAVIGVLAIVAGIAAFMILSSDPDEPTDQDKPAVPRDPLIAVAPVASNIVVGQSTADSTLTGEFSVPGSLYLFH